MITWGGLWVIGTPHGQSSVCPVGKDRVTWNEVQAKV